MNINHNDLTEIITQVLNEIKSELGDNFSLEKINLAEFERRTGISRAKLRRLKENNFVIKPHGLIGKKAESTVLSGYTGIIDTLLQKGVQNSAVIFDRLKENGYTGGRTSVKTYIREHRHLIPPKRQLTPPRGNRGRRYTTKPGECYQMDWGFINVENSSGKTYKIACFAMICHSCGKRYVEFFPNAKQENLFIGMIHAFLYMGVPQKILTDNMKSVVVRRDEEGHPIWQKDYELFMGNIGFETKLCRPRHPYTKGAVERLVRYVKDNFIAGRIFNEITDLNYQAINWCDYTDARYHRATDCVPSDKHTNVCMKRASILENTPELSFYLCPERRISFDGFVSYEGRRFGVPYWYTGKTCRVKRDGYNLEIYSEDMSKLLAVHDVTWGRRDSFCKDQYTSDQPEEEPSMPVRARIKQLELPESDLGFSRFNFEEGMNDE
jgi:transposase